MPTINHSLCIGIVQKVTSDILFEKNITRSKIKSVILKNVIAISFVKVSGMKLKSTEKKPDIIP